VEEAKSLVSHVYNRHAKSIQLMLLSLYLPFFFLFLFLFSFDILKLIIHIYLAKVKAYWSSLPLVYAATAEDVHALAAACCNKRRSLSAEEK
jgi:hypothetical protein